MAVYWEDHRCKVCDEPLDTEGEKDMGVHYECEDENPYLLHGEELRKAVEARIAGRR